MEDDDLINAFFSFDEPAKPYVTPRPQFEVNIKSEEKEIIDIKRENLGVDYSKRHRDKEAELLATQTFNQPSTSATFKVDLDDPDDDPIEVKIEDPELPELKVFKQYQFNLEPQKLPILKKREDILDRIRANYFLVLTADTGTGKSSQVPQYILEQAFKDEENCNIIITQPRRIGAITIAKRVALERRCELGTLVGYQIGMDKQMDQRLNSDTRILYCTTGVLLQKLINEKTMKNYTHVILDEVHERDVQMDMLLILVRRLFATRNPNVKIILMSATLNAEKIADFFKTHDKRGNFGPALIMDLKVPRPHPVKVTYLDSLKHLGASDNIVNFESPGISNEMYKLGLKAMELVLAKAKFQPSFLVFLPGIQEIERFKRLLYEPNPNLDISKFQLSVLHSSIHEEENLNAFDGSIENKIILSTNIAESSVTLPGVRFVIDFCLTKLQQTDTATNISQLKLSWASKMSLEQRAGRVGRLEAGQVVRLLFEEQYEALETETVPEMQRVSLETVVLQAKRLDMGKPSNILALALDPPPRTAIIDSILVLKEIGGLTRLNKRGVFDENDGEMTFAGEVMARLPVDVRISKLILLGYMFSCLEECIIIGAGMSTRSIFKNQPMERMEEYHQKLSQAQGLGSDSMAILNTYREWQKAVNEEGLKGRNEKRWCELKLLSLKNLREMKTLIEEIKKRLKVLTLKDNYRFNVEEKLFTIKICIAGAFYPNYFAFGGTPPWRDDFGTLMNMNPCTTVFLKGMEQGRIGQIYEKQVRQKLHKEGVTDGLEEMKVEFNDNSARLQVDFKPITNDGIKLVPGDVSLEVYKAVKLRKLKDKVELMVMRPHKEIPYAEQIGLGVLKLGKFEKFPKKVLRASRSIFPLNHQEESIYGHITHIVNCGKFFFQPNKGLENVKKLSVGINYEKIRNLDDAISGRRLMVMYNQVKMRGKIIEMPGLEEAEFTVYLVDTGEIIKSTFEDFYKCNGGKIALEAVFEMPPQCFQCRLSDLIPNPIRCLSGWSQRSTDAFKNFIKDKKLKITVNSFVDRIASVVLFADCPKTGATRRFDEELTVINNFAQTSDDSYLCLLNQNARETERKDKQRPKIEDELDDFNVVPPPDDMLVQDFVIDGPYSVLESRVESLSRMDMTNVVIEASSVNQVLFDPYPNDSVKKLLVAATMSKRESCVTLHQTTIMPHLPGMACLLALIFSPLAEVRLNNKKSRYSSILTGLGCNKHRKPHYGEHDCLFNVDVELDEEDFTMIDKLRKNMSYLMTSDGEIKLERDYNQKQKDKTRSQACLLLMNIMQKQRSQLGLNMDGREWNWRPFVKIEQKGDAMYPKLLEVEKLSPLSTKSRRDLKLHAEELARLAATNARNESIFCQLCEERIETLTDLKLHVMKKLHKDRTLRIRQEEDTI